MIGSGWPLVPIKEICEAVVDCVNKTDFRSGYAVQNDPNHEREGWIR